MNFDMAYLVKKDKEIAEQECQEEAQRLWNKFIEPYLPEIQKDESFMEMFNIIGGDVVQKNKKISPFLPIELIWKKYSFYFNPNYLLVEEILMFERFAETYKKFLGYGLKSAFEGGFVSMEGSNWCNKCGNCCTGNDGGILILDKDVKEIYPFLVNERKSRFDLSEEELKGYIYTLLFGIEDIGTRVLIDNIEFLILTCPFLERCNSKESLCIIHPVKPTACSRHNCQT